MQWFYLTISYCKLKMKRAWINFLKDVYMKQIDKTRFEWLPKKQLTNTVVEFR